MILLGTCLFILAGGASAGARSPGSWTQITGTDQGNTSEVSLARTADGVLHVAWSRPDPAHPGSEADLLDRHISAAGKVGPDSVIEAGWVDLQNPALVSIGSDGLDLFVGATRSLKHTETISNLAFLTSSDGGGKWTLQPGDVTSKGARVLR